MSESKLNLDIESCITTLQKLLEDTNQLFELPETQRIDITLIVTHSPSIISHGQQ